MDASSRFLSLAAVALVLGACSAPPSSEPSPVGGAAADTLDPSGVVGRVSLVEGVVSFRPAAADTWALADVNRPVTSGDRLWVDSAGRAEVEIGSNALRVGRETELDVTHLDADLVQLSVPQGRRRDAVKAVQVRRRVRDRPPERCHQTATGWGIPGETCRPTAIRRMSPCGRGHRGGDRRGLVVRGERGTTSDFSRRHDADVRHRRGGPNGTLSINGHQS